MTSGPADRLREGVEEIDKLIHEPARFLLMAHLRVVDDADFVFLLDRTGLTAGNVSSHMKKLIAAGYVEVEKTFVRNRPQTSYRLSPEGRSAFDRYRENIGEILDRLPGRRMGKPGAPGRLLVGFLLLLLPLSGAAARTGTITGRVPDAETRAPLPGAVVPAQPEGLQALSEAEGPVSSAAWTTGTICWSGAEGPARTRTTSTGSGP